MNSPCASRSNARLLTKLRRIVRSSEFRQVYDHGVRMTSRSFSAFCLHTTGETGPARIGFTLPRAVGKAVKRNRIKRRVREAVKRQIASLPADRLIVFNPRRSALDVDFEELCREIGRVFARCAQS